MSEAPEEVPIPAQIQWATVRKSVPRHTLEFDYSVILRFGLVDEHAEMMRGLTIVRDAVTAMQEKVTPPRFLPEEDAALLVQAGLPFKMELLS